LFAANGLRTRHAPSSLIADRYSSVNINNDVDNDVDNDVVKTPQTEFVNNGNSAAVIAEY